MELEWHFFSTFYLEVEEREVIQNHTKVVWDMMNVSEMKKNLTSKLISDISKIILVKVNRIDWKILFKI